MARAKKIALVMMLLILLSALVYVLSAEEDLVKCQSTVRKWADSALDEGVEEDKHTLKDLLFFLHVPRTGGRSYFHCFLRKLYANYLECPRSYDKLRFDPSTPDCRLLVTHDDYSVMSKLPKERTSVVTILRSPIDHVLSTYEFSVEVAARFLVHPNLTSATQMIGRVRLKNNGVSTLDIWPWKYLVPWMRADLFARRDARKHGGFEDIKENNDPYNMEGIVMPLHEFINDPVAHDIIHDGATFQVAGLTNNSFLAEAHVVRHCVRKYKDLGEYVLEVAKKRLDEMLYVGLTEEHKESARMFANMVGEQVISQLQALASTVKKAADNETVRSSSFADSEHDTDHLQNGTNGTNGENSPDTSSTEHAETINDSVTVGKLIEAYEECSSRLRKAQALRRTASLKRVSPANFSKEARHQIPEKVLRQILSLNSLDVELYKHAQDIFSQQRKHLEIKLVKAETEKKNAFNMEVLSPGGITFVLGVMVMGIFVIARRRRSKLKV